MYTPVHVHLYYNKFHCKSHSQILRETMLEKLNIHMPFNFTGSTAAGLCTGPVPS